MGNRVMAAKRLKMARQRRAWSKDYQRRGYMQPNREVIQEYKQRAKGLAVFDDAVDRLLSELVSPGKKEIKKDQRLREAVLQQAQLEAALPMDCTMRVRGPGPQHARLESFLYFNSQKTKFVLVHRDLNEGIERVSQPYPTKEVILLCWEGDNVLWKMKRQITVG